MQRYIAVRVFQSLVAIFVMSLIVFSLARLSGNPLEVMLPLEATEEDYTRLTEYWGLDKPILEQYWRFLIASLRLDFGHRFDGTAVHDVRLLDAAQARAARKPHRVVRHPPAHQQVAQCLF